MNWRTTLPWFAAALILVISLPVDAQRFPGPDRREPDKRGPDKRDPDKREDRFAGFEYIASRKVDFRDDRDTIEVAENDGRYTAILLEVEDGNLEMDKIEVVFADGEKFEPRLRHDFKEGSRSRTIELPGRGRLIQKVKFDYESRGRRGNATVNLYAKPLRRIPGYKWLGSAEAEARRDREGLSIGADDGRYNALLFEVEDGDIELHTMEITFGDGDVWRPDLRLRFNEGSRSRGLDLPGRARVIKRVDFRFTAFMRRGSAVIQLYGKTVVPVERRYPGFDYVASAEISRDGDGGVDVPETHGGVAAVMIEAEDLDVDLWEIWFTISRTPNRWKPELRHEFRAGERTKVIDLPGMNISLKRVDLGLRLPRNERDNDRARRERVTVNVYTRGGWDEEWKNPKDRFAGHDYITSRKLDSGSRRCTINLSEEDRYKALLFELDGGSLEISDIEIKFLNGDVLAPKDRLDFDHRNRSRSLDLGTRGRVVSEIRFNYRGNRSGDWRSTVNLYGKK